MVGGERKLIWLWATYKDQWHSFEETDPEVAYIIIICGTNDCDDWDAHHTSLKRKMQNPVDYLNKMKEDKDEWLTSLYEEIKVAINKWCD